VDRKYDVRVLYHRLPSFYEDDMHRYYASVLLQCDVPVVTSFLRPSAKMFAVFDWVQFIHTCCSIAKSVFDNVCCDISNGPVNVSINT
jgi:hypothetical protein